MKKTILWVFIFSLFIPNHIIPSSAPIKAIGGGILALAGTTGTIYCYKKAKNISKLLEQITEDNPLQKALQKKHKCYKILTFACGGIAILGTVLASYGTYQWATEKTDPDSIEKEIIIAFDSEEIITATQLPNGNFLIKKYQPDFKHLIEEKTFSEEALRKEITPEYNTKINTYTTMDQEKRRVKIIEYKFRKERADILYQFINNPEISLSLEKLLLLFCGTNTINLIPGNIP